MRWVKPLTASSMVTSTIAPVAGLVLRMPASASASTQVRTAKATATPISTLAGSHSSRLRPVRQATTVNTTAVTTTAAIVTISAVVGTGPVSSYRPWP